MHLQDTLKLPLIGEEKPIIPDPRIKNNRWSGIALEWMAYGYGVSFTPLQTLTFYNAVANNGTMVRPQFLREIREFGKPVKVFEKEIIDPQICSLETISKLKQLLANVVKNHMVPDIVCILMNLVWLEKQELVKRIIRIKIS